jgi:hypothetical protein
MRGQRGLSRRGRTTAGLALVALLVIPASAAAGTKAQSATLTTAGQEITLTPKCSRGQRATGGGFRASPPPSGLSPVAAFYESHKAGQRSWRVSAQETGGSSPILMTAYVYCAKHAAKTKTKMTTVPVSASGFSVADASCGSAGKAQSGGFAVPPPSSGNVGRLADSFRAAKKTWRSRALSSGGSPTLTSYADCADEASPKARSGSTSANVSGANVTALSAECKRGAKPVAGGFSQLDAVIGSRYIFPYEFFRNGKSWRASAQHLGSPGTTLTSIAYCS